MSRPSSLTSIVRARELREEQRLAELSRFERVAEEARGRLDEALRAIHTHDENERRQRGRGPWLAVAREYRRRLERGVYDARLDLEALQKNVETARAKAVEAAKERRSAEQLLERHLAGAGAARRHAEVVHMDDIGGRLRPAR